MTIAISDDGVGALLEMKEVVSAVEEAFRMEGMGQAANHRRSRSRAPGSVLNVMHATLPYLNRAGLKAYLSSPAGTKFVVILFDSGTSAPLAVLGADILGRYRTGAASAVATRHLFRGKSGTLALFGSGRQALTQVLAISEVLSVEAVRVWSPNAPHREAFASRLSKIGFRASALDSPAKAIEGAEVACAITSSRTPFLTASMVKQTSHLNICGGNVPEHAEASPEAVGSFDTVAVDDLPQARVEYGDLVQAVEAGTFAWESAVELCDVVAGKFTPRGRTLFKSGGAALEDVAVASLIYDKARSTDGRYPNVELT